MTGRGRQKVTTSVSTELYRPGSSCGTCRLILALDVNFLKLRQHASVDSTSRRAVQYVQQGGLQKQKQGVRIWQPCVNLGGNA